MRVTNCENPILIINPQLPQLLSKFGRYSMFGRSHRILHRMKVLNRFEERLFRPKRNGITLDNMDECFVFDDETGETYPMYLAVPCNHCNICKGAKINSFVHRCKLESQCYDSLPWFCTFTYADEHIPSDGVSVREMQLFMKRFRINLQRAGFSYKPRYVIVGEYGRKYHRPHYHAIFWNINSRSDLDYLKVSDILSQSWSKGFIQRRLVDLHDDKGFYYTSKYLRKDCFVPEGMNPCFMLSSRGKGGIGSRFIDSVSEKVRKSMNPDFHFLNKWTGKVENLCFCSYVLNRIFPSFCRSVPKSFRDDCVDCCVFMSHLKYNNEYKSVKQYYLKEYEIHYSTFFRDFYKKVSECFYLPVVSEELSRSVPRLRLSDTLLQLSVIEERLSSSFFTSVLPYFKKLQDKRDLFCSKMLSSLPLIDLSVKSHELGRRFALAAAREIF